MTLIPNNPLYVYRISLNDRDGLHFQSPNMDSAGFDGAYIYMRNQVQFPALILAEVVTCGIGRVAARNCVVNNADEIATYIDLWLALPVESRAEYYERVHGDGYIPAKD